MKVIAIMRDYKNILKGVCFLIVVACSSALAQTNSDYDSSPPFLATAVEPNILIVLDNSGSMCDQAYASSYDPSVFTNGQNYGYFDKPENVLRRERQKFSEIYQQRIKWHIDLPRLNYD